MSENLALARAIDELHQFLGYAAYAQGARFNVSGGAALTVSALEIAP